MVIDSGYVEAEPTDPDEWDVVRTIEGFDQLLRIIKKVKKCTPRLVTIDNSGHPLSQALSIVYECKQAAMLQYGKAMWQDAKEMNTYIDKEKKNG